MSAKFVDRINLTFASGHGGPGAVSFRREMFVPHGGPDGGDGGRGGDVIFVSNKSLSSFAHLYRLREIKAKNGEHGSGNQKHGKDGADVTIQVPVGTQLKDSADRILHDFTTDNETFLFLKGGLGGRGNARFASSTNQAPRYAQKGLPGNTVETILEMKLIADIGLVGFPNAGKSTFISAVTNARPKVAAYPFTTLTPHLGIFQLDELKSIVIADIPGIIEGAHEGKGLGLEFLRHIERTRFLFFLVDCTTEDPRAQFNILRHELESHSESLAQKNFAIGISKIDLLADPEERIAEIRGLFKGELESKLIFFSSIARLGLDQIRKLCYQVLDRTEKETLGDLPAKTGPLSV